MIPPTTPPATDAFVPVAKTIRVFKANMPTIIKTRIEMTMRMEFVSTVLKP